MKIAVGLSAGDTKNSVDAAPSHQDSPGVPSAWLCVGSSCTAKQVQGRIRVAVCPPAQYGGRRVGSAGHVVQHHQLQRSRAEDARAVELTRDVHKRHTTDRESISTCAAELAKIPPAL